MKSLEILLFSTVSMYICGQVPTALWVLYREWVDDVIDGQVRLPKTWEKDLRQVLKVLTHLKTIGFGLEIST